jgi:hypothetical protein
MMKLGITNWHYDDLRRVVSDGKRQRIEQCLNKFLVNLELEAVHRGLEAEQRAREDQLWDERERVRQERRERQEKEIERLKILEEDVNNWRRAEEIRAYVAAVETRTKREGGDIGYDTELCEWIAWARQKADWIDPLTDVKCPLLDADDSEVSE